MGRARCDDKARSAVIARAPARWWRTPAITCSRVAAAEQEEGEGIGVELVGHQVADRSRVLAGVGPVGAGATGLQLAGAGEQVDARRGGRLGDARLQLAVEQGGGVGGPRRDGGEHLLPLVVAELPDADAHRVGLGSAPLDDGPHLAPTHLQPRHHVPAGVGAAPRETVRVEPGPVLEGFHPRPAPPGGAEGRAARLAHAGPGHQPAPSCTSSVRSSSDSSRDPRLAVADHSFHQVPLRRDQLRDAVLHRALGEEAVDLYGAVLADAPGAVGGLVLDGRVPPAVVVDDVRGPR